MANYPEWVKQFRRKGTAVKKVGNSYYLYKHSSKRVPGKKYPQAVDSFIGVITPNGVIGKKRIKISLENIEVYEYGFSYALFHSCSTQWKKSMKDDWQDVLYTIIYKYSPNSYLLSDYESKTLNRNIELKEKQLIKELKVSWDEMLSLKTIFLLKFEEKNVISKINENQKQLLSKLGLEIGSVEG